MWPGDGPDHDEVKGDDQDRPDRVVGQPGEVGQDADRCDDDGDGAGQVWPRNCPTSPARFARACWRNSAVSGSSPSPRRRCCRVPLPIRPI